MEQLLIAGFLEEDSQRVEAHLTRLLPHLETSQVVLCGGLAIRHHLISRGVNYPIRPFNDLDIVAQSAGVVHPSVTKDFWVYHYHPGDPTHFYIVLLDPVSETKVDIFNWSNPAIATVDVQFNQHTVKIRGLEDQLVQTVSDMFRLFDGGVTDYKQLSDAKLMLQLSDPKMVARIWLARGFTGQFSSLPEALTKIEQLTQKDPTRLTDHTWRKSQPYRCPDCVNTPDFPLTPMEKIYEVLGYVE